MQRNVEDAIERFLRALSRKIDVKEVYLFGSHARGDWLKYSDIDLIVVSDDFRNMKFMGRLELVEEVQWNEKIRPHIEVIPLTPEEFEARTGALLGDASKYWKRIK